MNSNKKSTKHNIVDRLFSFLGIYKNSVSSAKLNGYNGKSFEGTIKKFWKGVEGFSFGWHEGWSEGFTSDVVLSERERAVTFKMKIQIDCDTENELGLLYMVHNTKTNTLCAVGFVDHNDGYLQEYTAKEITNALNTLFDEYN